MVDPNETTLTTPTANVTEPPGETWENIMAGSLCFLFTGGFFAINISVAWTLLSLNRLYRHFCLLVLSLAIADCGVLATFALWAAPLTAFQATDLGASIFGVIVGALSMFCYFTSLYAIIAITINRFLAVVFPFKYRVWVTMKKTIIVIGLCWGIGALFTIPTLRPGCHCIYNPSIYSWMWEEEPCAQDMGNNLDLRHGAAVGVFVLLINGCTIIALRLQAKIIRNQFVVNNQAAEVRQKKDICFFIQSCLNAVMLEIMLVTFFFISPVLGKGRWGLFLTTNLAWALNHAANGLILLSFNSDVQKALKKKFCCAKKPGRLSNSTANRCRSAVTVQDLRSEPNGDGAE